jgi:allantoicase
MGFLNTDFHFVHVQVFLYFLRRNNPYTHFSQQPHNKLTWGGIFCFVIFLQKKMKTKQKNNKILPATSACCGAVVRNECRDHFSFLSVLHTPARSIFLVQIGRPGPN